MPAPPVVDDGDEPARLQALLDAAPGPLQPLDASALDGYLCGVLLQSRRPSPESWLPLVADIEGRAAPPGPWLDALQALARRRHRVLDEAIGARRWFDPWVFEVEPEAEGGPGAEAATDRVGAGATDLGGPHAGGDAHGDGAGDHGFTAADREGGEDEAPDADPSVTAAMLPWVAGFATAMGRFPALLDSPDPALVEPLALLFLHLDPDDLEDADALLAVIETLEPPADLGEAVQDLVRALMLMADVTRPAATAGRPALRRPPRRR